MDETEQKAFWESVERFDFYATPYHSFLKIKSGDRPSYIVEIVVRRGPETDSLFEKTDPEKLKWSFERVMDK